MQLARMFREAAHEIGQGRTRLPAVLAGRNRFACARSVESRASKPGSAGMTIPRHSREKTGANSLAVMAAGILVCSAALADGLTPHVAEYKVKISVLSGSLDTRLTATPSGYVATHTIRPTGMARMFKRGAIEEVSEFSTSSEGVLPVRYSSNDTLTHDETQADLAFDWSRHSIEGSVNGAETQLVLDSFAHDRVSIQYELMLDLANGGASDTYVLFDVDRLKTLNVGRIGSRQISVPAGDFEAIGIQHQAEGSSRVTTLWCVEELGYLPAVIEQHKDGKLRLRASLVAYSPT